MVRKDENGRYSISRQMGVVLVGVLGTASVMAYFGYQGERDARIRVETRVELLEKDKDELKIKIEEARNYATVADKNNARLEGKFDEFSTIYAIKRETGRIR